MTTFAYTAIARDGRRTKGTLAADSRSAAVAQVVQQGLSPITVDEQRGANGSSGNGAKASAPGGLAARFGLSRPQTAPVAGKPGSVSQKAVEAFTRELANLLAGGVPLSRSLSLLRREAANANATQLWGEIHDDVVGGKSLADSLAKWPRSFS